MNRAQIRSISREGEEICKAILADESCWIYIDEQKEQHIAAQKTERARAKIEKMDRYEFLVEFLIKPEYRNEKNEAAHAIKDPYITDSYGWEVPIEEAIDRKEFTQHFPCNSRGYDTERQIEEFEGLDEVDEELRKNTTPRQREIIYAGVVEGATNEMIAKDLGTNKASISVQKNKTLRRLRKNEKLRFFFDSLKGTAYSCSENGASPSEDRENGSL